MVAAASLTPDWVARRLPARPAEAHKGDFGRLLVVAGSLDFPGAAVLTGLGAMRTGAGVVRIAMGESIVGRMAGAVPELTWLPLDEEAVGLVAPAGWRHLAAQARDFDAMVVGPGLGRQLAAQRRVRQLLSAVDMPCVVDADGLNALAATARWWTQIGGGPLVLTPHAGEFARLTGSDPPAADDDDARAAAALAAARQFAHVVVLKGARTVIASPDGELVRSDVATPALATAGSGDVLAGAIGAFLAAGVPPYDAAACGVAVHGAAGLLAEQRLGRAGTIAGDIAELLPVAIAGMGGAADR